MVAKTIAGASVLVVTSCAPMQSVTTTLHFRSAAGVEIDAADGTPLLPKDGPPETVHVASTTITSDGGVVHHVSLEATRAADGAIAFDWRTRLRLMVGAHETIVPADGVITFEQTLDETFRPHTFDAPELDVPWRAQIGWFDRRHHADYGAYARLTNGSAIDGDHAVVYRLRSDWSNVQEVRERIRPRTGDAWIIASVVTLAFGGFGTAVAVLPARTFKFKTEAERIAFLSGTFGFVVAIDASLMPTLLAKNTDRTVNVPTDRPR